LKPSRKTSTIGVDTSDLSPREHSPTVLGPKFISVEVTFDSQEKLKIVRHSLGNKRILTERHKDDRS